MRNLRFLTSALVLGWGGAAVLVGQATAKPNASTHKSDASRLHVVPAADVKWVDLDPKGAPGVKVADLWGNHATGAFGAFIKLPAGFAAPLHTHTNDLKVVILSGTYVQAPEGKPEFRIGAGSYFLQPGGNYRHTTTCEQGADCVLFVEGKGKFDLKLVQAAAAKPR
jgi:anti-sigma factor ChrR (cupin superfamily)